MSNCNFFLFVKLNIETHSVKGLSLYSVIAATSVITSQQNTHLQHHSHIMILIIITIIITCNRPVLSSVHNHHLNQMRNSKKNKCKRESNTAAARKRSKPTLDPVVLIYVNDVPNT